MKKIFNLIVLLSLSVSLFSQGDSIVGTVKIKTPLFEIEGTSVTSNISGNLLDKVDAADTTVLDDRYVLNRDSVSFSWGNLLTDTEAGGVVTIDVDPIPVSGLSATGTPGATTYLRGDNTWAVPAGSGWTPTGYVTRTAISSSITDDATIIPDAKAVYDYAVAKADTVQMIFGWGVDTTMNGLQNQMTMFADSSQVSTVYNVSVVDARVDSVATALADTIDIGQLVTMNDLADSVTLSSLAYMLIDTITWHQYGAGGGLAGDTILFDTIADGTGFKLGRKYIETDSLEILYFRTSLSAGDTLNALVYSNDSAYINTAGATIIDTLNITGGDSQITTTGFSTTTIPKGNYVCIEFLSSTNAMNPIWAVIDLVGYIKRD